MKIIRIKIFFLITALFCFGIIIPAKAQSDSISNKKKWPFIHYNPKKDPKRISQFYFCGSVGASNMEGLVSSFIGNVSLLGNNNGNALSGYFYKFLYGSPAYNLAMDYRFTEKYFIGFAVSYQYVKVVPVFIASNPPINYNGPKEIVSRLNMAFRYLHTIGNSDDGEFQGYWGFRAGYSYWKDELPDNPTYNALTSNNGNQAPTATYDYSQLGVRNESYLSVQFLVGMRSYFTPHFALDLEAGIGSPYILALGGTYILDREKAKK